MLKSFNLITAGACSLAVIVNVINGDIVGTILCILFAGLNLWAGLRNE